MARRKGSTPLKYSSRGSATNKFGVKFTAAEIKKFRNEVQRLNKRSRTYLHQMEKIRQSNANTVDSRIPIEPLYEKKSTSLQRFRNRQEFEDYSARMRKQGRSNYKEWRYKIERQNYYSALKNTFGETDARKLIIKANKISNEKLHKAFVSRNLEHTGYIYYDPDKSKLTQVSSQLDVLIKK